MTETEWRTRDNPILSFERELGWPSPRKQRLFVVACCRRVEHLAPGAYWWDCVAVAERFADRRAERDELEAAHAAVIGRRIPATRSTYGEHARQFGEAASLWVCSTTARGFASQAAVFAAGSVAYSTLPPEEAFNPPTQSPYQQEWSAAEKAEVAAQVALVYEICGNPFCPPVALDPTWLTADVITLARGMYEVRDFSATPILADALQDAGCDSADLLNHCRGDGPHVRGCWAIDLVLGKE